MATHHPSPPVMQLHHGPPGGPPPPGMVTQQQWPPAQQLAHQNEHVWLQIGMSIILLKSSLSINNADWSN